MWRRTAGLGMYVPPMIQSNLKTASGFGRGCSAMTRALGCERTLYRMYRVCETIRTPPTVVGMGGVVESSYASHAV